MSIENILHNAIYIYGNRHSIDFIYGSKKRKMRKMKMKNAKKKKNNIFQLTNFHDLYTVHCVENERKRESRNDRRKNAIYILRFVQTVAIQLFFFFFHCMCNDICSLNDPFFHVPISFLIL